MKLRNPVRKEHTLVWLDLRVTKEPDVVPKSKVRSCYRPSTVVGTLLHGTEVDTVVKD